MEFISAYTVITDLPVCYVYVRIGVITQQFMILPEGTYKPRNKSVALDRLSDYDPSAACSWDGHVHDLRDVLDSDSEFSTTVGELLATVRAMPWILQRILRTCSDGETPEYTAWSYRKRRSVRSYLVYQISTTPRQLMPTDPLVVCERVNQVALGEFPHLGVILIPCTLQIYDMTGRREPVTREEAIKAMAEARHWRAADTFALIVFMCDDLLCFFLIASYPLCSSNRCDGVYQRVHGYN